MPSIYGVTPADIAAELPGLFPGGFSAATKPSAATVQLWIDAADATAQLHVQQTSGDPAAASATAAAIAKRYIIDWTKANVLRAVYTGNDPRDVEAAARPFETQASGHLAMLDKLGEQNVGTGTGFSHVRGKTVSRDLLVSDVTLGAGARGGTTTKPY